MKKIDITIWLALVFHLFIFSYLAYEAYLLHGWGWYQPLIAIGLPLIFFYKNITEYNTKK